jgi:secondary thiamine-phosphate synthase enzyme
LTVETDAPLKAYDITPLLPTLDVRTGLAVLSIPHTSAALVLSEADEDLLADIEHVAKGLLASFEPFRHARAGNRNGRAHLMSALFGTQVLIPVVDAELHLGEWQRVILLELDGPKRREVFVQTFEGAESTAVGAMP